MCYVDCRLHRVHLCWRLAWWRTTVPWPHHQAPRYCSQSVQYDVHVLLYIVNRISSLAAPSRTGGWVVYTSVRSYERLCDAEQWRLECRAILVCCDCCLQTSSPDTDAAGTSTLMNFSATSFIGVMHILGEFSTYSIKLYFVLDYL